MKTIHSKEEAARLMRKIVRRAYPPKEGKQRRNAGYVLLAEDINEQLEKCGAQPIDEGPLSLLLDGVRLRPDTDSFAQVFFDVTKPLYKEVQALSSYWSHKSYLSRGDVYDNYSKEFMQLLITNRTTKEVWEIGTPKIAASRTDDCAALVGRAIEAGIKHVYFHDKEGELSQLEKIFKNSTDKRENMIRILSPPWIQMCSFLAVNPETASEVYYVFTRQGMPVEYFRTDNYCVSRFIDPLLEIKNKVVREGKCTIQGYGEFKLYQQSQD